VLYKSTLLGMRLAMVCVVCYVVIDSLSLSLSLYIYIYIYMCVCVCVCVCVWAG